MVLRLPKKKTPPKIGKKLQDYIDRNPGRMTNKILKLARSRKPTGKLNIDDFYNVRDTGVLAGTGFSGDRVKRGAKGPAGKVMKKKRGGKVDATNLNIKKKYGKALKERFQSKNSRARSR